MMTSHIGILWDWRSFVEILKFGTIDSNPYFNTQFATHNTCNSTSLTMDRETSHKNTFGHISQTLLHRIDYLPTRRGGEIVALVIS